MNILNTDNLKSYPVPADKEHLLTAVYDDDDFDCDNDLILNDGDYYEAVQLITQYGRC